MNAIVRNTVTPVCRLCKHIILDTKYPQEYTMERCLKPGRQCMISGEIKYEYGDYSRKPISQSKNLKTVIRDPLVFL